MFCPHSLRSCVRVCRMFRVFRVLSSPLVESLQVCSTSEGWKNLSNTVVKDLNAETEPMISVCEILRFFANNNVSLNSFWGPIFESKLNAKFQSEKVQLMYLLDVLESCNLVEFRPEIVINKLIATLLTNETVWVISNEEFVRSVSAIANSQTMHRQLFLEVSSRLKLEVDEFTMREISSLLTSFSKINLVEQSMFEKVMCSILQRGVTPEIDDLQHRVTIATAISKLRFRSDTFFKKLASDILNDESRIPVNVAAICIAMKRLKMHTGSTDWWDKESDYKQLCDIAKKEFTPNTIESMTCTDLSNFTQIVQLHAGPVTERLKQLLTNETTQSHKQLACIIGNILNAPIDNIRWIAEWLCNNVYILPVSDIAVINRSIAKLGFRDHSYHKIWVTYYLERIDELTKDDIACISETFNSVGMSDTILGGRHFFYKLGKRFQELTVNQSGDKEMNFNMKYRNLLQRIG